MLGLIGTLDRRPASSRPRANAAFASPPRCRYEPPKSPSLDTPSSTTPGAPEALPRPLQITDTNGRPIRLRDASKSGSIQDRLGDQINPATGLPTNPYFDTTAFLSLPSQYTVPPDPPYHSELRGPGRRSMDASLVKRVMVREGWNVEARVDVSNLTNTPAFDNPLTNMATPSTFGNDPDRRRGAHDPDGVSHQVLIPESATAE